MAIVINLDVDAECHLQSGGMPAGRFIGVPRLEPVALQEFANVHPFFAFELQRPYADITVGTREFQKRFAIGVRDTRFMLQRGFDFFCFKKL